VSAPLDLRSELQEWLSAAIAQAAPGAEAAAGLERPKQAAHGDYATTVALQLARTLRANPREVAARIVAALAPSPLVASATIAGAGYINILLTPFARHAAVREIHARGAAPGPARWR
jgi:arginyl-tRNA synthetase